MQQYLGSACGCPVATLAMISDAYYVEQGFGICSSICAQYNSEPHVVSLRLLHESQY